MSAARLGPGSLSSPSVLHSVPSVAAFSSPSVPPPRSRAGQSQDSLTTTLVRVMRAGLHSLSSSSFPSSASNEKLRNIFSRSRGRLQRAASRFVRSSTTSSRDTPSTALSSISTVSLPAHSLPPSTTTSTSLLTTSTSPPSLSLPPTTPLSWTATSSPTLDAQDVSLDDTSSRRSILPPALRSLGSILQECGLQRDFVGYMDAPRVDALKVIASNVSLPEVAAVCPLLDVLRPATADLYRSPTPAILVDPSTIGPLPRPVMLVGKGEYLPLLRRMANIGMLDWTLDPIAVNGVFAVPKDGDALRLIIDARPANCFFVSPPRVSLPTPDVLSQLSSEPGRDIFVAKLDISDFYHRLKIPVWMRRYFCLPAVLSDEFPELLRRFGPGKKVFPCLTTLPMGFSHAVALAQDAHEHIAETRSGLPATDRIQAGNDGRLNRLRYHIYIDDSSFISTNRQLVEDAQTRHECVLARLDLHVKPSKRQEASAAGVDVVGIELHGKEGTLGLSPTKVRKICAVTLSLLDRGSCSGLELSIVVGCWTWAMLTTRPALAIFSSVYKFIQAADRHSFCLWESVRKELETVVCLAPLFWLDITDQWAPVVVATDASSIGQGMVYANVPASLPAQVASVVNSAGFAADGTDDTSAIERRFGLPHSASSLLVAGCRWKVAISRRWSFSEHINVLEARALSTALVWSLSRPSCFGKKILFLVDSQVVVAAASKGRSSSHALLRRLRVNSALLLASGSRMAIRWIPTNLNPADAPSRLT